MCKSRSHMEALMDEVLGGKGEGVMIKNPNSPYEGKRSWSLLKVKRFLDTEATIINHT